MTKLPGVNRFDPETDGIHFMSPGQLCISLKSSETDCENGFKHKIYDILSGRNGKIAESLQAQAATNMDRVY